MMGDIKLVDWAPEFEGVPEFEGIEWADQGKGTSRRGRTSRWNAPGGPNGGRSDGPTYGWGGTASGSRGYGWGSEANEGWGGQTASASNDDGGAQGWGGAVRRSKEEWDAYIWGENPLNSDAWDEEDWRKWDGDEALQREMSDPFWTAAPTLPVGNLVPTGVAEVDDRAEAAIDFDYANLQKGVRSQAVAAEEERQAKEARDQEVEPEVSPYERQLYQRSRARPAPISGVLDFAPRTPAANLEVVRDDGAGDAADADDESDSEDGAWVDETPWGLGTDMDGPREWHAAGGGGTAAMLPTGAGSYWQAVAGAKDAWMKDDDVDYWELHDDESEADDAFWDDAGSEYYGYYDPAGVAADSASGEGGAPASEAEAYEHAEFDDIFHDGEVRVKPERMIFVNDGAQGTTFADIGVDPALCSALHECGFDEPISIQRGAFEPILKGIDVVMASQTGSGKTLAYLVPLLHDLLAAGTRQRKKVPPAADARPPVITLSRGGRVWEEVQTRDIRGGGGDGGG